MSGPLAGYDGHLATLAGTIRILEAQRNDLRERLRKYEPTAEPRAFDLVDGRAQPRVRS